MTDTDDRGGPDGQDDNATYPGNTNELPAILLIDPTARKRATRCPC
jgi:hypothetical protein